MRYLQEMTVDELEREKTRNKLALTIVGLVFAVIAAIHLVVGRFDFSWSRLLNLGFWAVEAALFLLVLTGWGMVSEINQRIVKKTRSSSTV